LSLRWIDGYTDHCISMDFSGNVVQDRYHDRSCDNTAGIWQLQL